MTWATTILREFKGAADDIVYRVAKQFEGRAETTENVAKAARMAKRLQARKVANPPTKPLARAPRAQLPAEKPKPKAQMPKLKAQTAKPLALPKPGPGLPEGASKPRGGQFWPDYNIGWRDGYHTNMSPEYAARRAAEDNIWHAEPLGGGPPLVEGESGALSTWLEKALAKYYKRDFGAPDDPLRDLAVRGLHYDPDMTPAGWRDTVNSTLDADLIGSYTVPDYWETRSAKSQREDLLENAPWLAKQPVTDKLYAISGGLDLSHFTDEMLNALRPDQSGLPNDLAVDISSLDRMSFPQAVERVGRINQWRAKQMEEAAAARLSSPAVQMYKEYPEAGMRWVELRRPEGSAGPSSLSETDQLYNQLQAMPGHNGGPILESDEGLAALQEQLKFEGDTMGHCVGGYCDDVAAGRSRIFSLRDAKGMPHVTVETAPKSMVYSDLVAHFGGDETLADDYLIRGYQAAENAPQDDRTSALAHAIQQAGVPRIEDIVQIKGKQNRAPNPEYLPYVQDFVKSGQWGEIGDLGNTGLVRLPDKRLIKQEHWQEGMRNALRAMNPEVDDSWLDQQLQGYASPASVGSDWDSIAAHFEGYKRGGRVKAAMPVDLKVNTCGCGGCA